MRAAQAADYLDIEKIAIAEIPVPEPGPGEVLVKVAFGGLRWADIMTINLAHGRLFEPPFTVGQEIAGEVETVGAGVTAFLPGQRVMGLYSHQGFAEYAAVPAEELEIVPDGVALDQALIYGLNLRVAYLACWPWGHVKPGETVLVHAGAGGVGGCLVQVLKRRFQDVTVLATSSSPEKLALARANGADHALDYVSGDYVAEVAKITGGRGVDLILNGVGGVTYEKDPACLALGARWLIFGGVGGHTVNLKGMAYQLNDILCRSVMPYRTMPEYEDATRFMWDWLATEPLDAPTVYPLSETLQAFRDLNERRTQGKVVIAM